MTISRPVSALVPEFKRPVKEQLIEIEPALLLITLSLISIGLIMVMSASITIADKNFSDPLFYLKRQMIYAMVGVGVMSVITRVRLVYWEKLGKVFLACALVLLVLVLIPGVGKAVNGSTRWIPLGMINLQVSEIVKLFLLIYVAGYLVRHGDSVRSTLWGFLKPMFMVGVAGILLLLEPDFGATVVIMGTVLAMTYLAGVRFLQFVSFLLLFGLSAFMLVIFSPYRMERLTSFMNPWSDPFDSGFQLTQSLIAIGSGEWFGVGLGSSVQKLFYLPEAHTDFVFAVLAEELGFVGVMFVIALYSLLFFRAFRIGLMAERHGNRFAAFLAYGIGVWLSLQAVINIGVNMGLFPTKGLTLPLMSYGGSSLIVCCMAIGLLLRIRLECGGSKQAVTYARPAGRLSRGRAAK